MRARRGPTPHKQATVSHRPFGLEGQGACAVVVSDAEGFAALASLVRSGGTALTTLDIADTDALAARGVAGVNFRLDMSMSRALLEQLANAVVTGRIVVPPIAQVELDNVRS